ncbi:hypothetical protein [Pseudobacillus wudalianchiensis]|uniref:Uncharacterized protein n=1 Tax=Pseudobacillus wudalianchiensis TaxID=1743143 RepID=A0A1B9BA08_9BACI|nr:hypothetical protein [Bacillus wudalianchiensis]OCA92914.1 hypothetical protein A8F95_04300 [Bacillus wudalianchiensis]
MNPAVEERIHLNDLSFIRLCSENYGINKGIYNTIDAWFYSQGVTNILDRRKNILFFLDYLQRKNGESRSKQKFGNGGLTMNLREYFTGTYSKTASNF